MAEHLVFKFKAELENSNPKVWRTFEINGEKTVAEFAYAIMIMFEMDPNHFWEIKQNDDYCAKIRQEVSMDRDNKIGELMYDPHRVEHYLYELPANPIPFSERFDANPVVIYDATKMKLSDSPLKHEKTEIVFRYDFETNWIVRLTMEAAPEKKEVSLKYLPQVIDGAGFGVVENCGGPIALQHIYLILHNPFHPQYPKLKRDADSIKIDLDRFDRDDLNFRIKKLSRSYRELYEEGLEFTEKSKSIFSREYYVDKTGSGK